MEWKTFLLTKMSWEWEDTLKEDSLALQPLVRKTELVDGEVTLQDQELNQLLSLKAEPVLFPHNLGV